MGTRELTPTSNNKTTESKAVVDPGKKDEAPVVRHDPAQAWIAPWIAQGAGGASPQDHLAKLSLSQSSQSSTRSQYVLQLQRRYGNRYVQRVLGQSRETEQEDAVSPEVEDGIQRSRGGGASLDANTRLQMESAFGADFGSVRVHTGAQADALNRAVNARAFTTGRDVFFREGEYRPGSSSGRELLAHELTHVVQQKNSYRQIFIQPDRVPGKKEPPLALEDTPARKGGFGIISSDEYEKKADFKDKGKISIVSSTKIIKAPEVLHSRQTPKGSEKLPYEYFLQHERRVEIETPSGDKAVLTIKADKCLPFDTLKAKPNISPKKAISLSGDFCSLKWSLEGKYGTEKFKEALRREYDISPIETTVQGKAIESFLASNFSQEEILKPKNPRDPCSLKGVTEKNGPSFLYFNLTDRQQYQRIVDYLDGLLADRLKAEADLRKLKQKSNKEKTAIEKEKPVPVKDTGTYASPAPRDINLPGWLKGIIAGIIILAAVIGAVAVIAAIIGLGAEIFAGAAFAAAFWTAFKVISTALFVINLIRSITNRFGEDNLSGAGDFFKKLGVSLLDAFAIGEMIESFTDRSLITGKPLNLSEEERWKRRTLGVAAILGAVFGLRSWLKRRSGGTTSTAPNAPAWIDYTKRLSSSGYASSLQGKEFGVFEGRIPGVKEPVAIKVYPEGHPVFEHDLAGAQAASRTGYAAKFYGEVPAGPGKKAFAMEKVPGGFPDAAGGASAAEVKEAAQAAANVTKQTVTDIKTYGQKLLDEGFYQWGGDIQGLVDTSGRWRAIDFQAIRKLPPKTNAAEYAEALKKHWSNVNSEADLLNNYANANARKP